MRPTNALNIGAVARAMANFGLGDLAVVSPFEFEWRKAYSAIYGTKILERARLASLEESVADCHLVLGTASAHNRVAPRTEVTLPALKKWIVRRLPKGGRVAVLIGSERNGLENAELSHCHALLKIPTCPQAPSMNLGQAVSLIAYEWEKTGLERSVKEPHRDLIDARQMEGLVETAMAAMVKTGVNRHMTEAGRRQKVRKGFLRWGMNRNDANWLRKMLKFLSEES